MRDPQVIALRQRVEATPDETVGRDGAITRLDLHDGTVLEQRVEHCIGSLDRPMTNNELEGKFLGQAVEVLPEANARHLMALCWRLPELDNVAEIAAHAFV